MRTITPALLAAQKAASSQPYVDVVVENRISNIVRLDFSQLNNTANTITRHDAAAAADGSLTRVRIESGTVKASRSASPQSSINSIWTNLQTGKGTQIACAAINTRVIIVYTLSGDTSIVYVESTDSGATFGAETAVLTAASAISDLAVAYKDNTGTLAIAYAESAKLWAARRPGTGTFNAAIQHGTTPSSVNGVALTYVFDWNAVVTGVEASTMKPTVWTTIFGDGVDQAANTWGTYVAQQQAESDAQVTYKAPSVAYSDQYRMRFVEADAFTGGTTRTWRSNLISGLFWPAGPFAWRTPAPVDYAGAEGLALAVAPNYVYESATDLVASAPRALASLSLTTRVIKTEITEVTGGPATGDIHGYIDIDNTDGAFAGPPPPLQLANLVKVSWGYLIAGAGVTSRMADLQISRIGYRRTGGVSVIRLQLTGGWDQLARDRQRTGIFHQAGIDSYTTILTRLFARAGISLSTAGASSRLSSVKPAFTVAPQTSARTALQQALAFVADRVFMSTSATARLREPLAGDASVYTFGTDHPTYEAQLDQVVTPASQAAAVGAAAYGEAIDFTNAQAYIGTRELIRDVTSSTGAAAAATAAAHLRTTQLDQPGGQLLAPPACGLELLDVVDITDPLVQPTPVLRRIRQIRWRYDQLAGVYDQLLTLGAV
ncbi:MAG: hypothetical protein IVW53_14600 [Chloroflexi bacterium]|nr:hypothetical protein [Chloroflexota bacterium]